MNGVIGWNRHLGEVCVCVYVCCILYRCMDWRIEIVLVSVYSFVYVYREIGGLKAGLIVCIRLCVYIYSIDWGIDTVLDRVYSFVYT